MAVSQHIRGLFSDVLHPPAADAGSGVRRIAAEAPDFDDVPTLVYEPGQDIHTLPQLADLLEPAVPPPVPKRRYRLRKHVRRRLRTGERIDLDSIVVRALPPPSLHPDTVPAPRDRRLLRAALLVASFVAFVMVGFLSVKHLASEAMPVEGPSSATSVRPAAVAASLRPEG